MTWHDMTWHDMTGHDMTWHNTKWHPITSHNMTWHDKPWYDMTWHISQVSECFRLWRTSFCALSSLERGLQMWPPSKLSYVTFKVRKPFQENWKPERLAQLLSFVKCSLSYNKVSVGTLVYLSKIRTNLGLHVHLKIPLWKLRFWLWNFD